MVFDKTANRFNCTLPADTYIYLHRGDESLILVVYLFIADHSVV